MAFVEQVIYQVYVNGVLYHDLAHVLDAELRMSFGRHDTLFLRVEYNRMTKNISAIKTWTDGSLIRVVYGRKPNLTTWYGYVNHSEVCTDADSSNHTQQITYVCIGTSAILNVDRTRTWSQVSPTYIAKKIALENRFRAVVSQSPWVLDYEVQAAESDFSFLNRVADRTGMRFRASGGTLYLLGPNVSMFGTATLHVPVYTFNKDMTVQDTMRHFRLMQGSNLPGTVVANRAIYGLDKNNGAIFNAVANPPTSTTVNYINTDRPARTYSEGLMIVQAWQNLSQFWIGAQAELFGSTQLYPGKLVKLQGAGLMDGTAGYWLVTCTKHLLRSSGLSSTLDRYLTEVEMMRNVKGADVLLQGEEHVIPEFVTMTVTGPQWAASTGGVVGV